MKGKVGNRVGTLRITASLRMDTLYRESVHVKAVRVFLFGLA